MSKEPCQCSDCQKFYKEHDRLIREFPTFKQQQELNWTSIQSFRTLCIKVTNELQRQISEREADEDIINILSDFPNVIGVAHCFSSSYETAIKLIEMGFYISFSGNLTFKNSHLPEVAKKLPLDKLLVETDSPFLSPVPFRGKTNEPGRARYVVEKLAEIFDSNIDHIASITTANAKKLFNLVY